MLAFPCVSLSSERYEARARECEERANNTRDVAVKPMLLSLTRAMARPGRKAPANTVSRRTGSLADQAGS